MDDTINFESLRNQTQSPHEWIDAYVAREGSNLETAKVDKVMSTLLSSVQIKCVEVHESVKESEAKISMAIPKFAGNMGAVISHLKACDNRLEHLSKSSTNEQSTAYSHIAELDRLKNNLQMGLKVAKELQQWEFRIRDVTTLLKEGRALQASQMIGELFKIAALIQASVQASGPPSAPPSPTRGGSSPLRGAKQTPPSTGNFAQRKAQLVRVANSVAKVICDRLTKIFSAAPLSSSAEQTPMSALATEVRTLTEVYLQVADANKTDGGLHDGDVSHTASANPADDLLNVIGDGLHQMMTDLWTNLFAKSTLSRAIDRFAVWQATQPADGSAGVYEEPAQLDANWGGDASPPAGSHQTGGQTLSDLDLFRKFAETATANLHARLPLIQSIVMHANTRAASNSDHTPPVTVERVLKDALGSAISQWHLPIEKRLHAACASQSPSASPSIAGETETTSQNGTVVAARLLEALDGAASIFASCRACADVPNLWVRTCEASPFAPNALLEVIVQGEITRLKTTLADSPLRPPATPTANQNANVLMHLVSDFDADINRCISHLTARVEMLTRTPFSYPTCLMQSIAACFANNIHTWLTRWNPFIQHFPRIARNASSANVDHELVHAASRLKIVAHNTSTKLKEIDDTLLRWIVPAHTAAPAPGTLAFALLHNSACTVNLPSKSDVSAIRDRVLALAEDIGSSSTLTDGATDSASSPILMCEPMSLMQEVSKNVSIAISSCGCSHSLHVVQMMFAPDALPSLVSASQTLLNGGGDLMPRDGVQTATQELLSLPNVLLETQIRPEFAREVLAATTNLVIEAAVSSVRAAPQLPKAGLLQVVVDLLFLWRITTSTLGNVSEKHLVDHLSSIIHALMQTLNGVLKGPNGTALGEELHVLMQGLPTPTPSAIEGVKMLLESKLL